MYSAMAVGGAGARSAQAIMWSGEVGMGRAGGGGGGSIRISGTVLDLPDNLPIHVGAAGTTPANAGANAKAPNGTNGEDSWVYSTAYSAFGGKGGVGGDFSGGSSSGSGSGGVGGAGGGNSGALGAAGAGGNSGTYSYGGGGTPDWSGGTGATAGTYVASGGPLTHPLPKITAGGNGGGGGRPDIPVFSAPSPTAGAAGNNGGFSVPGGTVSGSDGGYGGGGAMAQMDGVSPDVYGTGGGGANRFATGLVVFQVT